MSKTHLLSLILAQNAPFSMRIFKAFISVKWENVWMVDFAGTIRFRTPTFVNISYQIVQHKIVAVQGIPFINTDSRFLEAMN